MTIPHMGMIINSNQLKLYGHPPHICYNYTINQKTTWFVLLIRLVTQCICKDTP